MVGEGDTFQGEIFSLRNPDKFCPLGCGSVREARGKLGDAAGVLLVPSLVGLLIIQDHGMESIAHNCRSFFPSLLDVVVFFLERIHYLHSPDI